MEQIYDLIIIGSGPAGISAALRARSADLNFIVLDNSGIFGGKLNIIPEIDGFPSLLCKSGADLAAWLYAQTSERNIELRMERAEFLELTEPLKTVITDRNEYVTRAVLIASGTSPKNLRSFNNTPLPESGVFFTAVSDPGFFADKITAVAGSGREAVQSALYLSDISKSVCIISERNELCASRQLLDRLFDTPNITFIPGYKLIEIIGEEQVDAAWIKNTVTKEKKTLAVDAVILAEETAPNTHIADNTVTVNYEGYILAGEDCRTTVDLVYAAGDVRIKPERSILSAINDGQTAINSLLKDFSK